MYHDTDLPTPPVSPLDELAPAAKAYGWPASAVAPPRFGRLAMGVAAAGALALGVMGTVAYGVWFNHDQQTYAEAIAGARQALGASTPVTGGGAVPAGTMGTAVANAAPATPTTATPNATRNATRNATPVALTAPGASDEAQQAEEGGRLASWSGQVARPATADPQTARATDAAPTASSMSLAASRRSAAAADPPTQQLTAARPARDPRSADARAASSSERHAANTRHKSLFARMGQFFHRVSYRQHGNASQQDIYAHP